MPSRRNHIFAGVPSNKKSLSAAYEAWCQEFSGESEDLTPLEHLQNPGDIKVGIIGGGIAGLYSALLLKKQGVPFHIFEAERSRIGGRIFTHYFNCEPNQYFEAGAMRLPELDEHKPVFELIKYVNNMVEEKDKVELIEFHFAADNNLVYVNGKRDDSDEIMTTDYADEHPQQLGFGDRFTKKPSELLDEAVGPFVSLLNKNFQKGFQKLVEYDNYSMRGYLSEELKWDAEKINFVETMTDATNLYAYSFTEAVIDSWNFQDKIPTWWTVKGGLARLPNACRQAVGEENITMGAKVYKMERTAEGKILLYHTRSKEPQMFDKVIAAIPASVLRAMKRPRFNIKKEIALRSMGVLPLYKIGLRFKTRFWEKVSRPTFGGQSNTDLPCRQFIYPSNGIGDEGPGALHLYCVASDAYNRVSQTVAEQEQQAISDLSAVYGRDLIGNEFIESFAMSWAQHSSQGLATFLPGQFKYSLHRLRKPEKNIYFAGEHLSVHHAWIIGAIDSALYSCTKIIGKELLPLGMDNDSHNLDYISIKEALLAAAKKGIIAKVGSVKRLRRA